jgi:hypothetical protein
MEDRMSEYGIEKDYKNWALSFHQVKDVDVYPLARGNGTVDIAIKVLDGYNPWHIIREVQRYIDFKKPAHADVLVMLKKHPYEPQENDSFDYFRLLEKRIKDIEMEIERHSPSRYDLYINEKDSSYVVLNQLLERYMTIYARANGFLT